MKLLLAAAVLALFILIASPCHAQTLTPQDARATLTVARAQATAASELATANAPTATTPATTNIGCGKPSVVHTRPRRRMVAF